MTESHLNLRLSEQLNKLNEEKYDLKVEINELIKEVSEIKYQKEKYKSSLINYFLFVLILILILEYYRLTLGLQYGPLLYELFGFILLSLLFRLILINHYLMKLF